MQLLLSIFIAEFWYEQKPQCRFGLRTKSKSFLKLICKIYKDIKQERFVGSNFISNFILYCVKENHTNANRIAPTGKSIGLSTKLWVVWSYVSLFNSLIPWCDFFEYLLPNPESSEKSDLVTTIIYLFDKQFHQENCLS